MVNWKSEYIAMKLKYINSRNIITGGVKGAKGKGNPEGKGKSKGKAQKTQGKGGPANVTAPANVSGPGTSYLNYYAPSTYTDAPLPNKNADENPNIEISEFFRIFLKDNSLTKQWIGRYYPIVFETYDDVMNAWKKPVAPWKKMNGNRFLIVPPGQRAPRRPNVYPKAKKPIRVIKVPQQDNSRLNKFRIFKVSSLVGHDHPRYKGWNGQWYPKNFNSYEAALKDRKENPVFRSMDQAIWIIINPMDKAPAPHSHNDSLDGRYAPLLAEYN